MLHPIAPNYLVTSRGALHPSVPGFCGDISWHKDRFFISEVFRFEDLGFELVAEDFYKVFFREIQIGEFDVGALRFRPVQVPRRSRLECFELSAVEGHSRLPLPEVDRRFDGSSSLGAVKAWVQLCQAVPPSMLDPYYP